MNVVFRVDSSSKIGSGHVMRCLTLARKMRSLGYNCHFISREHSGNFIQHIEKLNFTVHRLPISTKTNSKTYYDNSLPAHYEWLGTSWEKDKRLTSKILKAIGNVIWLVIDHYSIDFRWEAGIKDLCDHILVIDDLADRKHNCDVLIDQTLGRTVCDYKNLVSEKTRLLTGSEFAILRDSFVHAREKAYNTLVPNNLSKVLVSLGGIDKDNATMKVLKQLVRNNIYQITVLLGPNALHYKTVSAFCCKYENIKHIQFTDDIAELMLSSDICIGAAGSTSWERACLGLPSILIPLADNQREISLKLSVSDAAVLIELDEVESLLEKKINELASRWKIFHNTNLRLCDGLGVNRLMLEITKTEFPSRFKYELVHAKHSDIQLVFDWQCNSATRQFALNPEIPTWEEHRNWMQEKLSQKKDYFYMIFDVTKQIKLGVVRLDWHSEGYYMVSIFVDPEHYGCGIATEALIYLDHLHPHITIEAFVLENNSASQRLFEKANYKRLNNEKFIRGPTI